MPVIKGKQIQPASTTASGVLTAAAQTVFGQKTFNSLATETTVIQTLQNNVGSASQYVSIAKPNGSITAAVGSTCFDSNTGVMWFKQSGAGNTGWVALPGRVYKTASQGFTTTVNTPVTDLLVTQQPNSIVAYSATLFWQSSAIIRSLQIAVTSTAGTFGGGQYSVFSGGNGTANESGYQITALNTRVGPTATSTTTPRVAHIDFLITTAGGGSTVSLSASISAAAGTVTINPGSFLEYRILN